MENATVSTTSITLQYSNSDVIFISGSLIISIFMVAANTLVMCLYCWKGRRLLNIQSNRLLLSLSICDFLSGIGVIFSALNNLLPIFENPTTTLGYTYRIIVDIYIAFLVKTNVMHLCGITLDRYISLFYAFRYHCIVTKKSIKRYIIAAWLIPLIASSIQLSWLYKVIVGHEDEDDIKYISDIEVWYSVVSFIIFLAIPLILLAAAFFAMFFEIRRILRSTPPHHSEGLFEESVKQRRVIYVFGVMYLTFVILAMPYFYLRLLIDIYFWMGNEIFINKGVAHWTIILKQLTSIINPVLYTATCPELKSLLQQVRRKIAIGISQPVLRYSFCQSNISVKDEINTIDDTEGILLIKGTTI